ncbi:MAG: hypothetical protein B7Y11_03140 [Sphingobacteriia bacterium 24-36-13]|nr:MAG: hypothetical protein B7Y11_03140 [Sphingobacteriia bacterium 24-36-13]
MSVIFCHSNQKVALLGQKAKSPQKLFCLLFKNSNQKVALLGQKAKSPQKLFCLLFKNCTYLLNSANN